MAEADTIMRKLADHNDAGLSINRLLRSILAEIGGYDKLAEEVVSLMNETANPQTKARLMCDVMRLIASQSVSDEDDLPEDPEDCLVALQQLVKCGGLGRIDPTTYPPADDPTSTADRGIWNPDGRPGSSGTSWLTFFAGLTGGAATDFNNAIR